MFIEIDDILVSAVSVCVYIAQRIVQPTRIKVQILRII